MGGAAKMPHLGGAYKARWLTGCVCRYHGRDIDFDDTVMKGPTGRVGLAESRDGISARVICRYGTRVCHVRMCRRYVTHVQICRRYAPHVSHCMATSGRICVCVMRRRARAPPPPVCLSVRICACMCP